MKLTTLATKSITAVSLFAVAVLPMANLSLARALPLRNPTASVTATPRTDNRISNLKSKALSEISRRVSRLNVLINQINNMKRLSSDQKQTFVTDIQQNISDLQALKAKIETETDLTTLISDAKSIIQSYRIFAVYIPKIRILATAEKQLETAAKMETLAAKLKSRIDEEGAGGTGVSALTTKYNDMMAQITKAKASSQAAYDAAMAVVPAGFPANASVLKSSAAQLKAAQQYLVAALKDAKDIRNALKPEEPSGTVTPTE